MGATSNELVLNVMAHRGKHNTSASFISTSSDSAGGIINIGSGASSCWRLDGVTQHFDRSRRATRSPTEALNGAG